MSLGKVVITDHGFADLHLERSILDEAGYELIEEQCKTEADVINAAAEADALLVQWAPVRAEALKALKHCRAVVRIGIGVDNVDVETARALDIPVCNVPDYCIAEVADHAVSLALAMARQLRQLDLRTRSGVWKITPDAPMPAFHASTFAVAGFGRIGRAVLDRARAFGFQLAAYDPFVPKSVIADAGVTSLGLEELFDRADVLSLHLPLNDQTRHIVNAQRLARMRPSAVIVNTSRGGLIDTIALADALSQGRPGSAGLDVYETEPLASDHPLRRRDNVLLTSHVAWYSEQSVPLLRRLATQECVRALRGEPLKNRVN
ncbi:MAG TPA: C-terminal binding protein [Tepidisphaeraceae bacterium]